MYGKRLEKLGKLGVQLKLITGDNALVAASLAKQIGIRRTRYFNRRHDPGHV